MECVPESRKIMQRDPQTRRHVASGKRSISRQRALIERLEARQGDAGAAHEFLAML
jgi:hypothetical protein